MLTRGDRWSCGTRPRRIPSVPNASPVSSVPSPRGPMSSSSSRSPSSPRSSPCPGTFTAAPRPRRRAAPRCGPRALDRSHERRLLRADRRRRAARPELLGQRLGHDEVLVGHERLPDGTVRGHGQPDAVADVQPRVAAGLLDEADHVARDPLGRQFRRHRGVEDDETPALERRRRDAGVGALDRRRQFVLALDEFDPARHDGAVGSFGPVTALGPLDRLLHLLAQARAGRTGVDGQLGDDAVLGGAIDRCERDLPHVHLVRDELGEGFQRHRVGDEDLELVQRQPDAQAVRLAQRQARWSTSPAPRPWRRRGPGRSAGPAGPASR